MNERPLPEQIDYSNGSADLADIESEDKCPQFGDHRHRASRSASNLKDGATCLRRTACRL
jgi:hypothetical protein